MINTSTPSQCDVVVIGSGIGGLTSAAILSKAGLDTCVVEMDARPGGYLAGFQRRKFSFDTAIHWLNQCGPGGTVRRLLDYVGPNAPETPELKRIRRYKGESFDYLLTNQPDDLMEQLAGEFPGEADSIRRFFRASERLGQAFAGLNTVTRARDTMGWLEQGLLFMRTTRYGMPFARYAGLSAEKAFAGRFKSDILRRIFCSELQILSCMVPVGWAYQNDFQIPPAGGSQAFPAFLTEKLQETGGTIAYRNRVDKILLDRKRVRGVEVLQGKGGGERATIHCKYIVAACDLETIYERALPPGAIDRQLLEKVDKAELYDSCVTISLGLDIDPREIGFDEELIYLSRDDISKQDHNDTNPELAGISILPPSLRDPSLAPPGKGTLTLYTNATIDYGDRWKTGPNDERGDAYKAFKQQYADVIIGRVAQHISPQLREHIEVCEVATPITHLRYTGNRDGSIMAARPTRANIRNRVAHYRTPVENLFLGGHWAEYGGGVPIAARAGANSAAMILYTENRKEFRALRDVLDQRDRSRPAVVGSV